MNGESGDQQYIRAEAILRKADRDLMDEAIRRGWRMLSNGKLGERHGRPDEQVISANNASLAWLSISRKYRASQWEIKGESRNASLQACDLERLSRFNEAIEIVSQESLVPGREGLVSARRIVLTAFLVSYPYKVPPQLRGEFSQWLWHDSGTSLLANFHREINKEPLKHGEIGRNAVLCGHPIARGDKLDFSHLEKLFSILPRAIRVLNLARPAASSKTLPPEPIGSTTPATSPLPPASREFPVMNPKDAARERFKSTHLMYLNGAAAVIHFSTGIGAGAQPLSHACVLHLVEGSPAWPCFDVRKQIGSTDQEKELAAIRQLAAFCKAHPEWRWVTWRSEHDYGFLPLKERAAILGDESAADGLPDTGQIVDVSRGLWTIYDEYAPVPRMENCWEMNSIKPKGLFTAKESATAWARNDHDALRASTFAKLKAIESVLQLAAEDRLIVGVPTTAPAGKPNTPPPAEPLYTLGPGLTIETKKGKAKLKPKMLTLLAKLRETGSVELQDVVGKSGDKIWKRRNDKRARKTVQQYINAYLFNPLNIVGLEVEISGDVISIKEAGEAET